MSKRIGIAIIFMAVFSVLNAQQKWNYIEVDKKSYELFQQKKWKELIEFNDKACEKGIEYFNLQARTGIAWFNLGKYRKATNWFFKAWENDQNLEWLQEYLYYSLVYSGRYTEASKMAVDFTNGLQQKINFQKMKPLQIALEGGYSWNPDFDQLLGSNMDVDLEVEENYGEAFFLKNYHFESVDYSHQIAPGVILNHNLTHIGIDKMEQLFWGARYNFQIDVKQNQYFLNPVFTLGKWYFSPSMNIMWGKSGLILGNYDPDTFYSSSYRFSDFIFTTSTWTNWGNFSPGAEINLATIANEGFTQASAWLTMYPLSNSNLYFTPRIYFKSDDENSFGYNTFGISGGFQLGQLHFYGNYLNGEMENFIESGGYVIANFPGRSSRKYMGSIYFPFAKKYQFVVRYLNQDVNEKYRVYQDATLFNEREYSYIKHTVTAGISWKF
ncbi:tetratricopeptide repeat protein [Draconibacterium sp.]|uniref:tetratricopeptide repeat protein n=1 Tax=Draconibacterium sp. TaxID=1965318 RepID=UPI003565CEDF